jgi:hypothetical protein
MQFTIVTPSFRSNRWLPLCIASVADQHGVSLEHIVQDSCSDDGVQDWLPKDPRVTAIIEKDSGMYDAVNRGFRRATGDFVAYLNCDEQYLPGALESVAQYFAAHPEVDVALADSIITDESGNYICHRCSLVPRKNQMWIRFPVLTSSLFLRRRVLHEWNLYCNTQWRDMGDFFWIREMILHGVRFGVLPRFTSTFADTGANMNLGANAGRERRQMLAMTPWWVEALRPLFAMVNRARLLRRGAMSGRPFEYQIFTRESLDKRVTFRAAQPTSFWPGRRAMRRQLSRAQA